MKAMSLRIIPADSFITASASTAWRRHERHDAARRHHPLLRHVPGVLRLLPASIRLAALMGERVIHIMTHDSIGLGEDGRPSAGRAPGAPPRHPEPQRVRPCDAVETVECWQLALEGRETPSVMALTRQNCRNFAAHWTTATNASSRLRDFAGAGQGADFDLRHRFGGVHCGGRQKLLAAQGVQAVSSRCRASSCSWRNPTRPAATVDRRCTGENRRRSPVRQGWDAIIGTDGGFVGMTASAPAGRIRKLYKHFGITAEKIARLR